MAVALDVQQVVNSIGWLAVDDQWRQRRRRQRLNWTGDVRFGLGNMVPVLDGRHIDLHLLYGTQWGLIAQGAFERGHSRNR